MSPFGIVFLMPTTDRLPEEVCSSIVPSAQGQANAAINRRCSLPTPFDNDAVAERLPGLGRWAIVRGRPIAVVGPNKTCDF
jgi:hypothetical protein